jgi:hypothetical protein
MKCTKRRLNDSIGVYGPWLGTKLQNYYIYRFCSPSRSTFMTGRHPSHVGHKDANSGGRRGPPGPLGLAIA